MDEPKHFNECVFPTVNGVTNILESSFKHKVKKFIWIGRVEECISKGKDNYYYNENDFAKYK